MIIMSYQILLILDDFYFLKGDLVFPTNSRV